jgi:hypothetical protein
MGGTAIVINEYEQMVTQARLVKSASRALEIQINNHKKHNR